MDFSLPLVLGTKLINFTTDVNEISSSLVAVEGTCRVISAKGTARNCKAGFCLPVHICCCAEDLTADCCFVENAPVLSSC